MHEMQISNHLSQMVFKVVESFNSKCFWCSSQPGAIFRFESIRYCSDMQHCIRIIKMPMKLISSVKPIEERNLIFSKALSLGLNLCRKLSAVNLKFFKSLQKLDTL